MDRELLQAISQIMDEKLVASENRILHRMDEKLAATEEKLIQRMDAQKEELIQRMDTQKEELIQRMDTQKEELIQRMDAQKGELRAEISSTESRIMTYIENRVESKIRVLADGYQALSEKLSRIDDMAQDIDEIKGSMAALEAAIIMNRNNIISLQQAQG